MWKVVGLITGKDCEVRGAKLKLITKGKAIFVNRALQKLYPLEVCSVTTECENQTNELNTNPVGNEGSHLRVEKSHNRQLSWIRVGKHKPCSITNCLLFWRLLQPTCARPWKVKGGVCQIIIVFLQYCMMQCLSF